MGPSILVSNALRALSLSGLAMNCACGSFGRCSGDTLMLRGSM